jgi:crotonobetainyl-CoA:carnitine CoA-transferase CaiB-like acyl-CoA transferase
VKMANKSRQRPLQDIRVIEFTAFAAGPVVTKTLAENGAEVIRVESRTRPDGFRTHYPPFKDNQPGLNRAGIFGFYNNDKLGITLNLKHPKGIELVKRLIARADIVVENFTPGTMKRLGLDYTSLVALNPKLIMMSSCNQGQTGPHASHPGFGSHLSSLSGFTNLIGYPGGPPMILYGPYIDYVAVNYGVVAILAALEYRNRTGKAQYIDLAQYETGVQFVSSVLLDYRVNGRVADRMGNRHAYAAPHGAYPCKGEDAWCALSIFSDEEWRILLHVMEDPEELTGPRFATVLARKEHEEELDRVISCWSVTQTAEGMSDRLLRAGLRAAPVQTMKDLFSDPQLSHRKVWRKLEHPELGAHHTEGPAFHLTKTPSQIRSPAPLLGEHNRRVYHEILGLSEEEIRTLAAEGVFD